MKNHLCIFIVILWPLLVKTINYQAHIAGPPDPPQIGDCLDDGVIFYIFQAGDVGYIEGETHGLVVSFDQGSRAWGCNGTDLPAVPKVNSGHTHPETKVGARIGDGEINTNGMMQDCPDDNAAAWCRDKGPEWFLPSRGELNELYKWYAKDKRGNKKLMENCGGVGIKEDWHWSSSELRENDAWGQFFSTGGEVYGTYKKPKGIVRAVRTF